MSYVSVGTGPHGVMLRKAENLAMSARGKCDAAMTMASSASVVEIAVGVGRIPALVSALPITVMPMIRHAGFILLHHNLNRSRLAYATSAEGDRTPIDDLWRGVVRCSRRIAKDRLISPVAGANPK